MRVLNVHEREIPVSLDEVGALIDSLASEHDALWPRTTWPPVRFDRPLGVGAVGGHGMIRYVVEEYRPGQSVRFRFAGVPGFEGHHRFEVLPGEGGAAVLRHTIDMRIGGRAFIRWPLVIRPLHDALVEDALAQAQASLGVAPTVRRWSPWVRVLRWVMSRGRGRGQLTPNPTRARREAEK